jgi:hypothetical protein
MTNLPRVQQALPSVHIAVCGCRAHILWIETLDSWPFPHSCVVSQWERSPDCWMEHTNESLEKQAKAIEKDLMAAYCWPDELPR